MKFTYVPNRLIEAAKDIALQHIKVHDVNFIAPNEKLKQLIEYISGLELYQVKKTALSLSEEEVLLIAGYLPHNYYSVKMQNLFLVFGYRSNKKACELLYAQWQNAYDNKDCNEYMKELLSVNEEFILLIRKNNLTEEAFKGILSSKSIPVNFGRECMYQKFPIGYSLLDKLNHFGVNQDTRLYHNCQFLFYTFCNKQDYIDADRTELLNTIKKYEDGMLRIFLCRFLAKLTLAELEKFYELAQYFNYKLGDASSEKYKKFFENEEIEIKEKYRDWLNRYKIHQYFGNDERSRFWKRYQFKSVDKFNYSNSVVLESDRYYIVEFLGDAMGPIYIYTKEVYENNVHRWMRGYSNSELRSQLYGTRNIASYRKAHQGNWQGIMHNKLIYNKIAEKVRW